MTWPSTIPLADAHIVRVLTREQATVWLEARYPSAPKEDVEAALSVCEKQVSAPQAIIRSEPQLRHEFAAAAFLLGATITQLSFTLQLARGTIHQGIRRRITQADIAEHRRDFRMRLESVQILYNAFIAVIRKTPTAFDGMSVPQLADFLEASVDFKEEP